MSTAVLLPNGKQAFLNAAGTPAVGCKLQTWAAGTSAPKTTWQDAGEGAANTNPIILDARGEAVIFWDGAYKVQLQDPAGAPIWTVDNVTGFYPGSASLIPTTDNAFDLGSVTFAWRNLYLGAAHAPALSPASGIISYYPRTPGEIAAGVMPVDFSYETDNPFRFGAVCNGVADDTTAFVNISAALAAAGGGVVRFIGTPLFNSAIITIPKNVTWEGPQSNPGVDFDTNNTGTYFKSGTIVLNGTYTIKLDNSACIRRCTIMEKNLSPTGPYPLPLTLLATAQAAIAAYHGIALTQIAADTRAEDLLIIGFAQAYYSTGNERTYIKRMYGDNIAGIWIDQSTDIARIEDCHMWPFPIAHKAFSASVWERTGAAYKMTNHFDGGMLTRCFEWAYDVGFDMQSNNSVHMTDCSCDSGSLGIGQIGFKFTGNSELVQLVDCKASGQDQGLYVNVVATSSIGAIDVIGGAYFGNFAHYVSDNHRAMTFVGTHFRDTNGGSRTAVTLNAGVTGTTNISECTFESMNHAYALAAGVPSENCRRWNNTYKVATSDTLEDRMLADGTNNKSRFYSVYNGGISGWSEFFRHASGSVAAPAISPINTIPWQINGQVNDGSVFSSLCTIRMATHGSAPALGSTPGCFIVSTNRSAGAVTDTLIVDELGNTTPVTDNSVTCGKSGFRWSAVWAANGAIQTSDERAKTDIEPSALGLAFIDSLRPVSYRWLVGGNRVTKTAESGEILETEPIPGVRTHWGLVAQEVKRAIDAAGVNDFAGWVLDDKDDPNSTQSLRYDQFIGPLVKAVQELSARLKDLEALVQP